MPIIEDSSAYENPGDSWKELIPHRGAMSLLDDVVAWNAARIHARSRSHRRPHHPLASEGVVRSLHLCEYGAQAMAVHGGLLARRAGTRAAPGFLVSLRAVELRVARIDDLDGDLDVHAEQLIADAAGWQYEFHIEHAGVVIAKGRAAVIAAPASHVERG